MNELDSKANTRAIDSLLNYETVKYFGNEEFEARRYDESMQRWEKAAVRSQTSLSFLNITQSAIIAIAVTLIMWRATAGVVAGTMTIGDLVLVNAFMIQIYIPLNFLGVLYREVKQALADMERMFALAHEHAEIADAPGAPALVVGAGEVRFEHVDFGYETNRQILFDVSFTIPAGEDRRGRRALRRRQEHALAGSSSASTTSKSGRITVNGQDIRHVRQASLRAAIGIVPQDTVLFNDSIEYNIAYGRPGRDARRDRRGGQARADPRVHREHARGLRDAGRRARAQALGRREAARRDRARRAQGAADPDLRRGDLRARLEVREGDPGGAQADRRGPDDAHDRAPALDDHRRRRDPRARPRADRRAGNARRASCFRRRVRPDVAAAADGSAGSGGVAPADERLSSPRGADALGPVEGPDEALYP